ncbi:P-loop NTPase fold protein [Aquibium sp. LZ166]|uniref:P-loop NTPase fold protein n=1 Tax=Aquibium pacificus TaxID=3153579 RepID=A0ABV3SEP0_9HYPH
MKIYLPSVVVEDDEGFSSDKDIFERAGLAQGMKNLVASVDDPLVIAFDGVWGSGKTTFLRMWAGELRKAGHPVIFFRCIRERLCRGRLRSTSA